MYKRTPARTSTQLATGPVITNVKLPKLELPTFCGDYKDWTSFFDQFSGAVTSNSRITAGQMLQYLKTSVKGDAAKFLSSLQITDANFSVASEILKNRYNKRLNFQAHVHEIVSQKPVTNENPKSLRDLMETIEEHRLDTLDSPWTIRTSFSCTSLERNCLPKQCWELLSPGRNHQRYLDMKKFIEKKNTRPWSSHTAVSISRRQEAYKQPTTWKISFKYIHISDYNVWMLRQKPQICQCQSFKALSIQDRAQLSKTKGLCFNCLRPGHRSEQCNGSTCKKCKRKHNSLLHLEANNNSTTASTAPTVTTSRTSPHGATNQAAKTVKKTKKNLQPHHSPRMKKKYFFPRQSFQLATTEKLTSEPFYTQDPKATSSGKMQYNALDWKKKKLMAEFWPSSRSQQHQKISKPDSEIERRRLHRHQNNCLSQIDQQSAFSCKCQRLDKT